MVCVAYLVLIPQQILEFLKAFLDQSDEKYNCYYNLCLSQNFTQRRYFEECVCIFVAKICQSGTMVLRGEILLMAKYFLAAMQLLCFTGDKDKMTRTI